MIVVISEAAKRSGFAGGLIASLPLVSLLSLLWLYWQTKDIPAVIDFSFGVLWFVLPSLVLFLLLPLLLKHGTPFYLALAGAVIATVATYAGFLIGLQRLGFIGLKP
ncbi:MAG: hypothetical protein KC476_01805 [Cyanobacteria bacterium HKST-UBA06]|nr:hypothetical protein [Cyanobacteria bacterium HKST-UBA06]